MAHGVAEIDFDAGAHVAGGVGEHIDAERTRVVWGDALEYGGALGLNDDGEVSGWYHRFELLLELGLCAGHIVVIFAAGGGAKHRPSQKIGMIPLGIPVAYPFGCEVEYTWGVGLSRDATLTSDYPPHPWLDMHYLQVATVYYPSAATAPRGLYPAVGVHGVESHGILHLGEYLSGR